MKSRCSIVFVLTLLAVFLLPWGITVEAQDFSHIRIVRLSFIEGDVQYQRPGGDWEDAKLNLPIQQRFRLQTSDGYAEVEFEKGLAIRLANDSSLEFTELSLLDGRRVTKLTLSAGTAVVTAHLSRADDLSLATPNLQLAVPHTAEFRLDVSPTDNWVTVFHGKINVESEAQQQALGGGRTVHENAAQASTLQVVKKPTRDDFDKWVAQREQALSEAQSESVIQNKGYTTGLGDLDLFGSWADIPDFGWGWQPYGVGANWTPFVAGQWIFMGNTGWNWISDEPWGWVPYHFGSWLNAPGQGWMWVPQGGLYWQPATATWVRTNNQLGWMPTPARPLKPIKSSKMNAAASRVIILASSGARTGSIRAARVIPVSQTQAATEIVSAAPPSFTSQSGPSNRPANSPINRITVSGLGETQPLQIRAPLSFAAPKLSSPLNVSPRSLAAPRSLPVGTPMIFRGSASAGGGFYGANRSAGGVYATRGAASGGGAAAHSSGTSVSGGVGAPVGHR